MNLSNLVSRLGLAFAFLTGLAGIRAQTALLSPDRVTFYTEPNFKGEALTVEAGATVENLARLQRTAGLPWSFAISSVRIEGAARAIVYAAPGFAGERVELAASVSDLYALPRNSPPGATWDRCIASLSVVGPPRTIVAAPPVRYDQPPREVYVVPAPPPAPPPIVREVRPALSPREADAIVQHAYREVLDRAADPAGLHSYRERLLRDGWSERQVVESLQHSNEARGINADAAIARMYREELGREPDPNGLAHYKQLWHDGWTQGQIRADLHQSAEGREHATRVMIARAYRELLGREPDENGYANYERLVRERGYGERELRAAIMNSPEYRQLHPRGR
ncbi:MAG TPA: DUF4214 domain-containing protein [Opitutaceae bacterium]|nr:DUF4214 domain-containing protein [Opitutaceae bacterium]